MQQEYFNTRKTSMGDGKETEMVISDPYCDGYVTADDEVALPN